MINVVTLTEENGMEELPPTWRLRLWEELVDFDGFASYCKAIGKSWESSADLCLASRERLETKSGAECVSAAWQNVLHVKSSQDTINKKEKTKQNNYTFYLDFLHFLTCTPQTSRRPPSWAGSQGLGARLLSLSLWIAHMFFVYFVFFHIQRAWPPEKQLCERAQPGYLPPLFLLMKHTMSRTKMRSAMAHISPMNHPWVAMSTCRLAAAGGNTEGVCQRWLTQFHSEPLNWKLCYLNAEQHWISQMLKRKFKVKYQPWWVEIVWGAVKDERKSLKQQPLIHQFQAACVHY